MDILLVVTVTAVWFMSEGVSGSHYQQHYQPPPPPPHYLPPPQYRPPPPSYHPPPPSYHHPSVECGISYSPNHCETCEPKPDKYTLYDTVDVGEYLKVMMEKKSPEIDLRVSFRDPSSTQKAIGQGFKSVHENPAKLDRHPWHAAVIKAYNLTFICSGTLVSSRVVVTAAACVHGKGDDLVVRMGQLDILSTWEPKRPIYEEKVVLVKIHPSYDPFKGNYNVALLLLEKPVDFYRYPNIRPICLPKKHDYSSTDACIVAGWHAAPKKLLTKTLMTDLYASTPPPTPYTEATSPYAPPQPTADPYSQSKPPTDYSTTTPYASTVPPSTYTTAGYGEKPAVSYFQQSNSKVLQEACVKLVDKHQCKLSDNYEASRAQPAYQVPSPVEGQASYQPPPGTGYSQPPPVQSPYQPPPGPGYPQPPPVQSPYQPPPGPGYPQPTPAPDQTTYQPPPPTTPAPGYTQPPGAPQQPSYAKTTDVNMQQGYEQMQDYQQPYVDGRSERSHAPNQGYMKPDFGYKTKPEHTYGHNEEHERCLVKQCYDQKPCVGDLGSGVVCLQGKYTERKCEESKHYGYHQKPNYGVPVHQPGYGKPKEYATPEDKYSARAQSSLVAEEYDEYYEDHSAQYTKDGPDSRTAQAYNEKIITVPQLIKEKEYCKKCYVLSAIVSKKAKCTGYGAQPDTVLVQSIEPVLYFIMEEVSKG